MPYLLKSSARQDCGQTVKVRLSFEGGKKKKKRDSVDKATGAHYLVVYAGPRRTIDGCQRRVWSRQMGLHPTFHTKDDCAGITRPWKWHVGAVILDYLSASLSFAVLLRVARSTSDNITNSGWASNRCESVFDLYCQDTECVAAGARLSLHSSSADQVFSFFFFDRMCDAGGQVGQRQFRLRKRKCFCMSCRPTSWPTCVSDHICCSQVCKPYLLQLSSDCTHTQNYNSKRSCLVWSTLILQSVELSPLTCMKVWSNTSAKQLRKQKDKRKSCIIQQLFAVCQSGYSLNRRT